MVLVKVTENVKVINECLEMTHSFYLSINLPQLPSRVLFIYPNLDSGNTDLITSFGLF